MEAPGIFHTQECPDGCMSKYQDYLNSLNKVQELLFLKIDCNFNMNDISYGVKPIMNNL